MDGTLLEETFTEQDAPTKVSKASKVLTLDTVTSAQPPHARKSTEKSLVVGTSVDFASALEARSPTGMIEYDQLPKGEIEAGSVFNHRHDGHFLNKGWKKRFTQGSPKKKKLGEVTIGGTHDDLSVDSEEWDAMSQSSLASVLDMEDAIARFDTDRDGRMVRVVCRSVGPLSLLS